MIAPPFIYLPRQGFLSGPGSQARGGSALAGSVRAPAAGLPAHAHPQRRVWKTCLLLHTIPTHVMLIPQPNLTDLVSTLVTNYRHSLRCVPNSSFPGKAGVPTGRVRVCDAKLGEKESDRAGQVQVCL